MEWVFGNTLICKDAEAAKRVTFDKNVRMKSVTIDGDVYDPFGTLSGGSKPNSAGILVRVQELNQVRQQIRRHKETLAKVEQELTNSQRVISDYKRRKQMLDLKSHEIHLLEERLRQSTHSQVSVAKRSACPPCRLLIASILPIFLSSQIVAQVASIKEEQQAQEKAIVAARRQRKDALEECERIEKEMAEFNSDKGSKLKEMQQKIATLKAAVAKDSSKIKNMQRDVQTLKMELGECSALHCSAAERNCLQLRCVYTIEQMDADAASAQTEISQLRDTMEEYKRECSTAKTDMETLKVSTDQTSGSRKRKT